MWVIIKPHHNTNNHCLNALENHLLTNLPGALKIKLCMCLDVFEQFPILGIGQHKVEPLGVLETAVQVHHVGTGIA